MTQRLMQWLLAFATVWVTTGCNTTSVYRTSRAPCDLAQPQPAASGKPVWERSGSGCASSWAVRSPTHGVNYVEIDEQGMLANRDAVEDALAFAGASGSKGLPTYVVVFIHGWHHNGSPDDGNVQAFHDALHAFQQWHPDHDVRGIYIAWRGQSINVPVLENLTFWDRKSTSDEVGRGGLLEFLLRLERVVKPPPQALVDPAVMQAKAENRLVLIGHSFGASVAFNALAHVFMDRFIAGVYATGAGSRFRGYGDLVVLINPAIEAMRYMPFQAALDYYTQPADGSARPVADFSQEWLPRLVILSSQGDWATHIFFPAARFFSMSLERHERITTKYSPAPPDAAASSASLSEWVLDRDTVGNASELQTHWPLHILETAPTGNTDVASANSPQIQKVKVGTVPRCRALSKQRVRELLTMARPEASDLPVDEFPDSHIRAPRREGRLAWSPYVVAEVGKEIIQDHNTIDGRNLICWINQLVDGEDVGGER